MWTCEQCGTTNIAAGLLACPHCGDSPAPAERKDGDMPKATKHGGESWPPEETASTDSSPSTSQSDSSPSKSEPESQSPALTTPNPSESDQTGVSTAPSTDGGRSADAVRETDEGVGPYEEWRRDDLWNEADARGLRPGSKATIGQLAELLREDDATAPLA